jgi:predicted metal-dependent hydrolase
LEEQGNMQPQADQFVELETPNGRTVRVLTRTNPRARRLSLTVGAGGPRLSAPAGTHPSTVRAFLRENAGWVQKKLRELDLTSRKLLPPVPGRNETLSFRGVELPVLWEHGAFPRVRVDGPEMVVSLNLDHPEVTRHAQRAMRNFLVREIRREASRYVGYYGMLIGKTPSAFRFAPMRTLWGSLSSGGRMALDLSLILAPPKALEYVIVHEMCHLWVRNHGPRFWSRVADAFPEVDEQRAWLNDHGHTIKHEISRWIGVKMD